MAKDEGKDPAGPADTQDDEDEVKYLDNGKTRLRIDGKTVVLGLPRLGQYKRLRQMALDSVDKARVAAAAGKSIDEIEEVTRFMRAVLHGDSDLGVKALADRPFDVPEDDWPAWMVGGNLHQQLLLHWRAVPLDRG